MSSCRHIRRTVAILILSGPLGAPVLAQSRGPAASTTAPSHGHAVASPSVAASRRSGPITLDGKLDEAIWASAEASSNFRQSAPDDGQPATQRTEVRFLFDDDAIYIGARMYDSEGAAGVRTRLVRRDQNTDTDRIDLIFDTYHNHLGRTMLSINPSGVRSDAGQASEFMDPSWDPVWEGKTAIDDEGWTAEIRIPFSQLRFPADSLQTWGLQIWRTVSRINEVSMWSYWRSAAGHAAWN